MRPRRKSASENPLAEAWGLTGGIASGKSTVARILSEHGFPVVDADRISRELSGEGGAAREAILGRFGTADRKELRELVFSDPQARRDLEGILHPLIRAESIAQIRRALARARTGSPPDTPTPPAIYEATLLVETGRFHELRGLIVVVSNRSSRLQRLIGRDRLSPEWAARILDAQISDQERARHATWTLENDGSLDDLRRLVLKLIPALAGG